MPSSTDDLLIRDDYVNHQDAQNTFIDKEFQAIRRSVDLVKQELKEFKDDVREFKDDVREFKDDVMSNFARVDERFKIEFARVDERFNELQLSILRIDAYSRNNNLRNPTLRIHPIVSFRPNSGIVHPDPTLYPQNPKQFYALRHCSTTRQKEMLTYLIDFYDLPYTTWHNDSSPEESDSAASSDANPNMTISDAVRYHSDLAIDTLEGILGLNPDNFLKFQHRAAELSHVTTQPTKRSHNFATEQPRKLASPFYSLNIRPKSVATSESDQDAEHKSDSPGVGWAKNTTPSAVRRIRRDAPKDDGDCGSATNSFTNTPVDRSIAGS